MSSDKVSKVSSKSEARSKETNFSYAKYFQCSWTTRFLLIGILGVLASFAWCQTLVSEENDTVERLSDNESPCAGKGTKEDPWRCTELVLGDDVLRKHIKDNTLQAVKDECDESKLTCVTRNSENIYAPFMHCQNQWKTWKVGFYPIYKTWTLKKKAKKVGDNIEFTILYEESKLYYNWEVITYRLLKNKDGKSGNMIWKLSSGEFFGCWKTQAENKLNLYASFANGLERSEDE